MNENESYVAMPTANPVAAAAQPTKSQPRGLSSARAARNIFRMKLTKIQTQAKTPAKPISMFAGGLREEAEPHR